MRLQESGEMYLETILILSHGSSRVRCVDVGEHMGFSKPSVSRAIGLLKSAGYVISDKGGCLVLTESGRDIAEKIYRRHRVITEFLCSFGVSEQTAAADACKIEHDISDESFEAIANFVKKNK